LYKYQQWLYKFYNYNNVSKWLERETKIDKAIEAVRTGKYVDNMSMCDYINACVVCVEEVERGMYQDGNIIRSKRVDLERRRNKRIG
jgi:hypothetical protein